MARERQSNIELLRVIVMYMILLLHANFLLFGWPQGNNVVSLFRFTVQSVTIVAVNVFVLITGYFGTSFKISKVLNLCFQVLFAVVSVSLLFIVFGLYQINTIKDFARGFRFWHYWFINAYIGLVFLCPILNLAIKQMTQRQYKIILISLFVLFSILHGDLVLTPHGLNLAGGYSTIWFVYLYLLGRYIAIYSIDTNYSKLSILTVYCIGLIGTFLSMKLLHNNSYNNPFVAIQSLAFFILFLKFSFKNRALNFVASSSLMVFLLHRHPILATYYNRSIVQLNTVYGDTVKFIIAVLLFCALVFLLAILYDQLRKYLWSFVEPLAKKCDRFTDALN